MIISIFICLLVYFYMYMNGIQITLPQTEGFETLFMGNIYESDDEEEEDKEDEGDEGDEEDEEENKEDKTDRNEVEGEDEETEDVMSSDTLEEEYENISK